MGRAVRVARKMGIRLAMFCPSSAAVLAVIMSLQKLIDDEVIFEEAKALALSTIPDLKQIKKKIKIERKRKMKMKMKVNR
ncbi:hypothetical protein E3N88_06877 [Mikania micrantha]|uniref:Uncharacterized protein n=1 Tax=Mikania micrantha TaxID=192012 RepID=A0A5N6PQP5_9ASTR|nr:hypothetical protein E3N88_06877 [Mikania micrantha]